MPHASPNEWRDKDFVLNMTDVVEPELVRAFPHLSRLIRTMLSDVFTKDIVPFVECMGRIARVRDDELSPIVDRLREVASVVRHHAWLLHGSTHPSVN
jgi:hypothetical protein